MGYYYHHHSTTMQTALPFRPHSPASVIAKEQAEQRLLSFICKEQRQQTLKRPRRSVHFAETSLCYPPDQSSTTTATTPSHLSWYSQDELAQWRADARNQCHSMPYHNTSTQCTLSVDPATRGLESRACRERQRRRHLVLKCILKHSNSTTPPDTLAALAQRCTRYASALARQEAEQDYEEVYGAVLVDTSSSSSTRKRSISVSPEEAEDTVPQHSSKRMRVMFAENR